MYGMCGMYGMYGMFLMIGLMDGLFFHVSCNADKVFSFDSKKDAIKGIYNDQGIYSAYYVSDKEKLQFLFTTFDIHPHDYYLGYAELELFQRLTDPQLPFDVTTYKYIIALLDGSIRYGIDIYAFNRSYYEYKHQLGTDLHKDYMIIHTLLLQQRAY